MGKYIPLYSFKEEIKNNIQNKIYYSQDELCYKLSCALEGLLTLESLGIVHRNIKPSNLLIMKDGSLVISDLGLSLKLQYRFDDLELEIGTQAYWTPELIEILQKLKNQDYYDYIQSPNAITNFKTIDLYALGICFVQAASLTQLPKFQNKKNFLEIFKKERQTWLETQFTKLKQQNQYTPDLISLLESLVQEEIRQRISLHEAAQKLVQIQNQ